MNVCKKIVFGLIVGLIIGGCDYPYEPELQGPPPGTVVDLSARIVPINPGTQTCNPSITQNQQYFPGCMAWLNLQGPFDVRFPDPNNTNYPKTFRDNYPDKASIPHERITISDSTNTVVWYLRKPDFVNGSEVQDPEWCTHPDYIAFLGSDFSLKWDGMVVRISDKSVLKFNEDMLKDYSTPHIWLPDPATIPAPDFSATATLSNTTFSANDDSSGMVDKTTINQYFGTDTVKITFCKGTASGISIFYIDYSEAAPQLRQLERPAGKGPQWICESPLISPDGNWVAYNCKIGNGAETNEAYIQELAEGSKPIRIASVGAEPHWWKDPVDSALYIVYTDRGGPLPSELNDNTNDGSIGSTFIQAVDFEKLAEASQNNYGTWIASLGMLFELGDFPFKGGLSRDGRFFSTGYQYTYLYKL
ncbi:MAG: hypothetical protein GF401_12750 [Chitinivibrionales bacterium]|nr:hypothetical protein [Chitinivibrionales bacterium]